MSLLVSRFAGLFALVVAGQGLAAAQAADFDGPYPSRPSEYGEPAYRELPPPPPPVFRRPHFSAGPDFAPPERCRSFVKRRIDADGEEVVRRVRVCDEPGGYDDGPRRRPVFFDHPPRPPADIPDRGWGGPRW